MSKQELKKISEEIRSIKSELSKESSVRGLDLYSDVMHLADKFEQERDFLKGVADSLMDDQFDYVEEDLEGIQRRLKGYIDSIKDTLREVRKR